MVLVKTQRFGSLYRFMGMTIFMFVIGMRSSAVCLLLNKDTCITHGVHACNRMSPRAP